MKYIRTGRNELHRGSEYVDFDATQALPGSPDKLKVLCQRAERGLPLWHHDDCVDDPHLVACLQNARRVLYDQL